MQHLSKRALTIGAIELKGDEVDGVSIVTKAVEELTKTVDDRLKAVEEKSDNSKLGERLDKLEAKSNRPAGSEDSKDETVEAEKKAFGNYLRLGNQLSPDDAKALNESTDSQGGFLAPEELSNEFVRDLVEFSPIRSIASVRNINAPSVKYPKRTNVTNAQWEDELEDSTESAITFGQIEIPVKKLMTYVDISNELLADSGGSAESEVRMALAEDYGQKEGLAFVEGDGVKEPEGLLTNAGITHTLNGHATNLSADQLITLMYAMPAVYRNRGSWLMNGSTIATIRKLKDGNGNYLWQPSYQAGQPETILGRPVVDAVDMPDVASGNFPIMFGDFNTGFRIVDRLSMSILVNPYLLATKGVTRIHATRRVGGKVIQPKAIRKLKMATS